MADSRLAVVEKEHQRREALSDFFPSLALQYTATADIYQQQILISTLAGQPAANNVLALSGIHPSRWIVRGDPPFSGLAPSYPYRIDPYRSFALLATVTQPLFTGGRLLNDYKFSKLAVDYSSLQFEVDRQDLILDVYETYYQMLQSIKLLDVANESIRALEALRHQARAFYIEGVSPQVDVLSAEGQLAQARIQKTQAATYIQRARAALNFLLRYPQETPIEIVEDLSYQPNPYRIPDIYATAAANRLEIRQANISVDQAIALIKSAEADLLPSVSVQVKAARLNDDWNVFDPEGNNAWGILCLLNWSFDIFRQRETIKDKRASQARAFVAREQLVEEIMKEVKQAYLDVERSQRDIQDSRHAVAFRRESFRVSQEGYKEQVTTYIEVLDAQRQLAQAQSDYYTALIGYKINQAVLERRLGILR
jgi:outer membrane protein TolC